MKETLPIIELKGTDTAMRDDGGTVYLVRGGRRMWWSLKAKAYKVHDGFDMRFKVADIPIADYALMHVLAGYPVTIDGVSVKHPSVPDPVAGVRCWRLKDGPWHNCDRVRLRNGKYEEVLTDGTVAKRENVWTDESIAAAVVQWKDLVECPDTPYQPQPAPLTVGMTLTTDADKRRVPVGARVNYIDGPHTLVAKYDADGGGRVLLEDGDERPLYNGMGTDWTILSLPSQPADLATLRAQLAAAVASAERAENSYSEVRGEAVAFKGRALVAERRAEQAEARVRELEAADALKAHPAPPDTRQVRLYTIIGRHGNLVPFMDRAKRDTKAIQWGEAHGPDQLVTEVIP